MTITTNASYDQLNSPYYLENQQLGQLWEEFSSAYNGNIKGTYNAWSCRYQIELTSSNPIKIEIEKSTFSGGNLLLSSKYQNLKEVLTISIPVHEKEHFQIDKSAWYQITRKKVLDSDYKLKGKRSPVAEQVVQLTKPFIKKNLINSISCSNGILEIKIRHQNSNTEFVKNAIELFTPDVASKVS